MRLVHESAITLIATGGIVFLDISCHSRRHMTILVLYKHTKLTWREVAGPYGCEQTTVGRYMLTDLINVKRIF